MFYNFPFIHQNLLNLTRDEIVYGSDKMLTLNYTIRNKGPELMPKYRITLPEGNNLEIANYGICEKEKDHKNHIICKHKIKPNAEVNYNNN